MSIATDKQSKEKVDALKAFGAEVIVCPTNVDPEDPRSYYSVSSRSRGGPEQLEGESMTTVELGRALRADRTEIWDQTDGRVTHLVVGVGTGGTISSAGRYLKERNPSLKVWGIDAWFGLQDAETGIFDKNEIPAHHRGHRGGLLPKNVDFDVIDHAEKVTDKDAAQMTRRIAREENIFAGNSAGSAMAGLLQLKDNFRKDDVVGRLPRSRVACLGKMFNDDWMRRRASSRRQA